MRHDGRDAQVGTKATKGEHRTVNAEPRRPSEGAPRLPVANVRQLDRVLSGDPGTEALVIQYIGARWRAKNLFHVPRDKAAEILKNPAEFIRCLERRSQPELSF